MIFKEITNGLFGDALIKEERVFEVLRQGALPTP